MERKIGAKNGEERRLNKWRSKGNRSARAAERTREWTGRWEEKEARSEKDKAATIGPSMRL